MQEWLDILRSGHKDSSASIDRQDVVSEAQNVTEAPAQLLEEVVRELNDRELALKLSLAFHKHGLARLSRGAWATS